ncbi:heme oxygenase-like protein [Tuber magnatum]|uniref:Heme oxygenase-like protein n=1 Tax=Tuber magnatum TaxID=42249 RepID=A0A317T1H4_9PEZI|nr:heme oxygenase-like protein [Tuber magnatum]
MAHHQHFHARAEKETQGPLSLSQQINTATREGHDKINIMIMSRLSLGLRDHKLYREGILSFALVYRAFEDAWMAAISPEAITEPRIKSALQNLYSLPLLRTPQLVKDLEYFSDRETQRLVQPMWPARAKYVSHIKRILSQKPHLVIAYAHNYYMALFAGFFPRRGGMTEEECKVAGTNLFSFEVPKGKEDLLRSGFKDALADIQSTLTGEERTEIIEESKAIFENNEMLILELDRFCAAMTPPSRDTGMLTVGENREMAFIRTHKLEILFVMVFCYAAVKLFFF